MLIITIDQIQMGFEVKIYQNGELITSREYLTNDYRRVFESLEILLKCNVIYMPP